MAGLLLLTIIAVGLIIADKFTAEALDFFKFLAGFFMAVRFGANVSENMGGKKDG